MDDWNMSRQDSVREAPNYLNANIAMFGVNLTWILFFVWATMGFFAVLITAVIINTLITILKARMTLEPRQPQRPHQE